VKECVRQFNQGQIRSAYTFDAGPNAFILLERYNIQDFVDILKLNFNINY